MPTPSQRPIETLFESARSRAAGPERAAYLDGACGDDADLRVRLEALLRAHDEASGFLEEPALAGAREGPGSSIGPYKLLQEIGEGGMGVVYMAEQERPVRRKVAIKVIKLGMDTKQVIARFEAERQALALMDHANIARVLDAGATESGRPYFVMELVRGVPIDAYCDTHKLPTEERLRLFVEVCRAVQHAHQKGIIHRDLKPTNVLVSSHDGRPVPKIIDFGVAKATHQKLTERTLFTEFHQLIGTPEYMSPEQAEMSGLDVDTRSDIYALGVLLYQLLTGTTPVDPQQLRTVGFKEMTRMIREQEAPAPSTRISKLGPGGEQIAHLRNSDAGALSRHFRGDLDWIVMKALEKDRTRRYDTAAAFAQDVQRHLEDRPVEAGPPGALYRLSKFAHRNRKAVAAVLVLVAVVALGLAGTTTGYLSAREEARRSSRISASLQDVLSMTDPARAAERADIEQVLTTVREVFGSDHATYAAVLDTLAQRLHDAGDMQAAEELSRDSLQVWRNVYGEGHPNVAIALGRRGTYLRALGDDEQAELALREALVIFDGASRTPILASHPARMALADLLANQGQYEEADRLLGEALAMLRASPSPAHFSILEALEQRVAVQLNQPAGAVLETLREMYEQSHAFYPDDSPMLAITALGYGKHLIQAGRTEEAESYLREALGRFRRLPNPPVFYSVVAADSLFQVLRNREDDESAREADELLRGLIDIAQSFWSLDEQVVNRRYLVRRLVERGELGEALVVLIECVELLVAAERPADERDSLRGDLVEIAFQRLLDPDLEREDYARALRAMQLAQVEQPDNLYMAAGLAAALYRSGDAAGALERLEALGEPLAAAPAPLARKVTPIALAFGGLAQARLGNLDAARAQLQALREHFNEHGDGGERGRSILRELEALTQNAAAPGGG